MFRYRMRRIVTRRIITACLTKKFDTGRITIENIPGQKITIRDPSFHALPAKRQHDQVSELIPECFRKNFLIETFDTSSVVDRQVMQVHIEKDIKLSRNENIAATPQSLLDSAVFNLKKQSGVLASESLWLCGSLALKNFCHSNGFNPNRHHSKDIVVEFLKTTFKEYEPELRTSWDGLHRCHSNAYEDFTLSLENIYPYLTTAETFCNTLFAIHQTRQFNLDI